MASETALPPAALNESMMGFQQGLQGLVMFALAIQLILSGALLFLWFKFKKEKMPSWAMAVVALASLLALNPVLAVIVFALSFAYQKFAVKTDDWSAVFVRHALVAGALGLVFTLFALAMFLFAGSVLAQAYGV